MGILYFPLLTKALNGGNSEHWYVVAVFVQCHS